MRGRLGAHHWAEIAGADVEMRDVIRHLGSRLRGLIAVSVSWDSGKLQERAPLPAGWSIVGGHVVSPPVDDAILANWPQSACNAGRYDEWYFFKVLPQRLQLQALCNWGGVRLPTAHEIAFPGGFDLAGQLAATMPAVVVGEGATLFAISLDPGAVREFLDCAREPHKAST